jgi:ABC-type transport system involved in multi-copper enzyme maturation permease subunit
MAVSALAALTLKEAFRRKTLWAILLLGLLVLGITLLLAIAHMRMEHLVAIGRWSPQEEAIRYPLARRSITALCLGGIKVFGALFAAVLAGGAISGEIETGVMALLLPRPYPRWQIVAGKWLGLNLLLCGSTLFWTFIAWASLTLQTHLALTALLVAGFYLCLYPLLVSTIALTFSTVAPRLLGTVFALVLCGIAWFDGVMEGLSVAFNIDVLHRLAVIAGLIVPQGYVGYWVDDVTSDIVFSEGPRFWSSPRFLTEWGAQHLHFPRLDALYVLLYLVAFFVLGVVLFERRDVI